MTIKRTRPDRSEAMKGKPPLNPKGRPKNQIKVEIISEVEALLTFNGKMVQGDKNLIIKCQKALMRNQKK